MLKFFSMPKTIKSNQDPSSSKKAGGKLSSKNSHVSKVTVNKNKKTVLINSLPSANWKQFVAENGAKQTNPVKKRFKSMPREDVNISTTSETTKKSEVDENAKRKLTKVIAMDCEMVGVEDARRNMLARVSIVNRFGECIYDKYVKPTEPVKDYRTWVSGVRPHDLENGEDFITVKQEVADILRGRLLVGHSLKNDFSSLTLKHPKRNTRDTSKFSVFKKMFNSRTPSLRALAKSVLGVNIQDGEHSSVIDAKAALQLYMAYRNEWEQEIAANQRKKQSDADVLVA